MANKVALETWQKSLKQVCAETGRDVEEVLDEIAQAAEYAKKLGLKVGEEYES